MKHIWSILCRKSIVDPDNNIISISEALEELEVGIPETEMASPAINIPIPFELTSYWVKEGGVVPKGTILIFDPKDKKLGEFPFDLGFKDGTTRSRTRVKFSGLVLTSEGEYKFKVGFKKDSSGKFEQVAELPLFVKFNIVKTNNVESKGK